MDTKITLPSSLLLWVYVFHSSKNILWLDFLGDLSVIDLNFSSMTGSKQVNLVTTNEKNLFDFHLRAENMLAMTKMTEMNSKLGHLAENSEKKIQLGLEHLPN